MQDLTQFIANHLGLTYAFAVILILLLVVETLRLKRQNYRITSANAVQLINHQNAVVIDVRSSEQYKQGHIIDAISMSQQELTTKTPKLEKFKNKPIIVVCNVGMESQKVAALLLKQGYNAYTLSGGIKAWSEAGMPLVKA